jgi:hypothetical protein
MLRNSLAMHQQRATAIESSAAATKEGTSRFEAHKYKLAMWAAETAEREARKKRSREADTSRYCHTIAQKQTKAPALIHLTTARANETSK